MCMSFVLTVLTYIALNGLEILMPSVNSVNIYMSQYALESPVSWADLIALSPGYRVLLDLATIPYVPRYTRFALTEAATSD